LNSNQRQQAKIELQKTRTKPGDSLTAAETNQCRRPATTRLLHQSIVLEVTELRINLRNTAEKTLPKKLTLK